MIYYLKLWEYMIELNLLTRLMKFLKKSVTLQLNSDV